MAKKDDILTKLAIITDSFDKLTFKSKKISTSISLNNVEFDEMFKLFYENKITDGDNTFSIFIDNYEIIVIKQI